MAKSRSEHQQRIEQFMLQAGQKLPISPCIPPEPVRLLRARLILEECLETISALGFMIGIPPDNYNEPLTIDTCQFFANDSQDLVAIADGCADISVVMIGTLSSCGISDETLLCEVDEANLRKFGPGHSIREDGKVIKSPDFIGPDIARVLKEQGWDG